MNSHLVILKKAYIKAILSGQKTIESRFTLTKRVYFGRVLAGDKLFLKESSGPVCAVATAASVKNFTGLTPERISELKEKYNLLILGSNQYWQGRMDCKFGLLVLLKDTRAIKPVLIGKRDWRAWVVLTEKENFGLLEPHKGKIAQ